VASRFRRIVRQIVPWVSLGLGVASAIYMDRRPERAPLIAMAAAGGWVLLALLAMLESWRSKALLARAARLGASMGSQSLVQLSLFFSIPFYYKAASIPAHWGFLGLVGAAGVVTLWSPLADAALRHSIFSSLLLAVATFAGLDCVLPLLGLSNKISLLVAVIWTAGGLPLLAMARRSNLLAPLAVSLALVIAYVYGVAQFVPPAPLRFVEGVMGTKVTSRQLAGVATEFSSLPDQLVCYTAVGAPNGLRDRLLHVWRQNGAWRAKIGLEIRGGRPQGFRTWSTFRGPTPGTWTCTVETESGQRLGRVTTHVRP
jgi:hypothetical protein